MSQEAIKPTQTKLSLAFCVFTSALCESVCLFGVVCQYSLERKCSYGEQATASSLRCVFVPARVI